MKYVGKSYSKSPEQVRIIARITPEKVDSTGF